MNKVEDEIVLIASQPVDIEELTKSLSQVYLKEKESSTLKEENNALEKSNKEYQDRNTRLKDKLKGKSVL